MKAAYSSLLLLFILSGCAKLQIVDEVKIVQSLGYDIEGETIKGYAAYPLYKNTHRGSPLVLLRGESDTVQGVIPSFTAQSQYPIAIGQTQSIVISKPFAEKGITELVSVLTRDPAMGSNATVVITNQPTKKILTHSLKQPPYYLSNLIEQNMLDGNTPTTNFHLLLNQFYGEGQDVFLPMLRMDPDGLLVMDGVGIFREEKLKLQISGKEGLFLKLLKDKKLTGKYEFKTPGNDRIFLYFLYGRRNISVTNEKAVISLTLHTQIKESPNPMNNKRMNDLKKQIEQELHAQITEILKKFQNENVDPVGFGELCRAKQRGWDEKVFYNKTYPELRFIVHTEVIFSQVGVGT